MTRCGACGIDNADGTAFCVNCGAVLPAAAPSAAPPPPAYDAPPSYQPGSSGSYLPPAQAPMQVQPAAGGTQPLHPGIAALLGFLLPGLPLFFLPSKSKNNLAIMFLVGYIVFAGVLIVFSTVLGALTFIGGCCIFIWPLANIAGALHAYDMFAQESNGQFKPLIFKT
jgi:hypothetical protein